MAFSNIPSAGWRVGLLEPPEFVNHGLVRKGRLSKPGLETAFTITAQIRFLGFKAHFFGPDPHFFFQMLAKTSFSGFIAAPGAFLPTLFFHCPSESKTFFERIVLFLVGCSDYTFQRFFFFCHLAGHSPQSSLEDNRPEAVFFFFGPTPFFFFSLRVPTPPLNTLGFGLFFLGKNSPQYPPLKNKFWVLSRRTLF